MAKQSGKARRAAAERERRRVRANQDVQGRVHLSLYRDRATGQERVTLQAPLFKEAWQNEIVAGAANTAHAILREGPSVARIAELARTVTAAMSRLSEALLANAPAGSVACRAGCDHCCHQVVGVTPPEAIAIVEHLKQTLSAEELDHVRAHVADCVERARGLASSERFSPQHPCVFLRSGSCSVYEVRPLSCRGMNSLDAEECATRLREPRARAEFLESGRGGKSYLQPIGGAQAVSAGLQLGASELYHLDMRPLDLAHAVHLLLGADESLAEQWLNGQQPFAAAVHEAKDLGLREIVGTLPPPGDRPR
jgi:Fe-S-cluster containining protein